MADHIFEKEEMFLDSVSMNVWIEMLSIAHKEDLMKGGLLDARAGCINFWVSPGDKPQGYDTPITKDGLAYERNYLATLYAHLVSVKVKGVDDPSRIQGKVDLYLVVSNYAAKDEWLKGKEAQELTSKQRQEGRYSILHLNAWDWTWARDKVYQLIGKAKSKVGI